MEGQTPGRTPGSSSEEDALVRRVLRMLVMAAGDIPEGRASAGAMFITSSPCLLRKFAMC